MPPRNEAIPARKRFFDVFDSEVKAATQKNTFRGMRDAGPDTENLEEVAAFQQKVRKDHPLGPFLVIPWFMLEFQNFEHSAVNFKHGDDFGFFTETAISFFSF